MLISKWQKQQWHLYQLILYNSVMKANTLESVSSDSQIVPSKKVYFHGPYRRQQWSLPDSIIYYIAMNPSSATLYEKLIRYCKYFFSKNPSIVIEDMVYFAKKWNLNNGTISLTEISQEVWINDFIYVESESPSNVVSSIIPKIYKCDAKDVYLDNQILSFKEFLFLASKSEDIEFDQVTVNDEENGSSIVPFEKLVEVVPKFQKIFFKMDAHLSNGYVTSKTMKKLLKIKHFAKIEEIWLYNINGNFDIETFYGYMKKNKETDFRLEFDDSISAAYRKRVSAIIKENLAKRNADYRKPTIFLC